MKQWTIAVLATVLGCLAWGQAFADGTLIPASSVEDMVYDGSRGIIYISDQFEVLRYGLDCGCMLAPIQIPGGAVIYGIDLSPNGQTLAVANDKTDSQNAWVDLINPDTLQVTSAPFHLTFGESGTTDVSFLGDGSLVTTSAGSDVVPMRRLDLSSMTWSTVAPRVWKFARTAVSGDGKVLAYGEPISGGPWGVYYPASGTVYDGTSGDQTHGIGVNSDGTQFAVVNTNLTYIFDANHQQVGTIGQPGQTPYGVAYDPVKPLAYFPWSGTSEVRVYDMDTFQEVTRYDVVDKVQLRTRISHDGLVLMVSVSGGVRFLTLLTTDPVSADSNGGRVRITLPPTSPQVPAGYGLASQPSHGQAFVNGDQLTYVPDPGFTGTDTFSYTAEYHHVRATATVTINVTADTSAYDPVVSFNTLPALQASTPIPGSARVPGDINGDGTSDMLWFNPGSSQFGYWAMSANAGGAVKRIGARTFNITSGYFIGAAGDLDGDGYTDLVFTSANHDLWLWTNSRTGGFRSRRIYDYPADWQLIGAGDVNGDGKDDLLWLDPSTCQFAYWLMDGPTRIGARVISVACGYYPASVGYYTPSKRLSILWTSAAGDLYMWDAQANGGFRSYDLSSVYSMLGQNTADPRGRWAIGGGVAGQGIGIEWHDPASRTGFGVSLSRIFDSKGVQTSFQPAFTWSGSQSMLNAASGNYLVQGSGASTSALYVIDDSTHSTGTIDALQGNDAPQPDGAKQWTYPDGWYVVGAPANGAYPLPWH